MVCIINQTIAHNFFPGTDPLGKRLKLYSTGADIPWRTVVGVAQGVRGYSLETEPLPVVYLPNEQENQNIMSIVVRAETSSAAALERTIRGAIKSLDPALPLANYRTMERLVTNAVARPRLNTFLLGLFAITALILTAVGLYAVVAYGVSQRVHEIGIRMALGATGRSVVALVMRQGMVPALIGLIIGLAGALTLTRLLASQLYQVRATDPLTFFCVIVVLLLVALAACLFPARRAAKVDPMVALRYE